MPSVPLDFLGNLRRTHNCGELRASDAGKKALLMGWVHRRRDLGGVVFIHLRDREGVLSIVAALNGCFEVQLATRFRSGAASRAIPTRQESEPFLDNS